MVLCILLDKSWILETKTLQREFSTTTIGIRTYEYQYATFIFSTMHLICSPNFCIIFVFHFSWVFKLSKEKLKTILNMQYFLSKQGALWEMWKQLIACFKNFTFLFLYPVMSCPNSCFHNGDCVGSVCFCYHGWTGEDCSKFHCEDLHGCSGSGECVGPNVCKCYAGFKVSL